MLDNFRSQKIVWDIANRDMYEEIEAHQGDSNGRKLIVKVINNGVVEDLTGSTLSLATQHEEFVGLDALTPIDIAQGVFEIYYTTEMLSNVGNINASLVLVTTDSRIESKRFRISVIKSNVDDGAVESDNSFTALTQALIQVNEYESRIEQNENDITGLTGRVDTSETEIVNLKDRATTNEGKTAQNTADIIDNYQELTSHLAESDYQSLTLVNGWSGEFIYKIDTHNTLHMSINANGGVKNSGTLLATLPVGFRPSRQFIATGTTMSGSATDNTSVGIMIRSDGSISLIGTAKQYLTATFTVSGGVA